MRRPFILAGMAAAGAALTGAAIIGPYALGAAASSGVTVVAAVDGHDVSRSSNGHPIVLRPTTPATLDLTVTDHTSAPLDMRTVRMSGHVMGLTFYSYDIAVDTTVAAGETVHLTLPVDLGGLRGQATGLIAGSVEVFGPRSVSIASVSMVTDVRGSAHSVYGVFGIAIAIIALIGIGGALVGLARGTLPVNRFVRAVRFAAPFAALGLLVVFTLSAFRVLVPRAASEIPIVAVTAVIGFVVGYLTPSPIADADEEDEEDEEKIGDARVDAVGEPVAVGAIPLGVGARPTTGDGVATRPTEQDEPAGAPQPSTAADPGPGIPT